ncbi:hypothetical protein LTR04_005419 [Oleoguttula sp. CCFEE 6159]|nr:hypothetical protein LTR04_005419 [Oleoguttula sp. CCFEE 6159]
MPIRPSSLVCLRAFSTTTSLFAKSTKQKLLADHAGVPPYPYGPSQWYKQSNHGLYGGQRIQFGNNVSERTEIKTRRTWHPNIKYKKLFSLALNRKIRIRVSTRVLRTIDKVGGLDEYLLGEKAMRIKELGMGGWKLRWRIMQTDRMKRRFRLQRIALGLPPDGPVFTSDGKAASEQEVAEEIRDYDEELDREDARAPTEAEMDGAGVVEEVLEDVRDAQPLQGEPVREAPRAA